jgi:hypothetical protein
LKFIVNSSAAQSNIRNINGLQKQTMTIFKSPWSGGTAFAADDGPAPGRRPVAPRRCGPDRSPLRRRIRTATAQRAASRVTGYLSQVCGDL